MRRKAKHQVHFLTAEKSPAHASQSDVKAADVNGELSRDCEVRAEGRLYGKVEVALRVAQIQTAVERLVLAEHPGGSLSLPCQSDWPTCCNDAGSLKPCAKRSKPGDRKAHVVIEESDEIA
jgi:hypothetical protein